MSTNKFSRGFGSGGYWKKATGQEVFKFLFYITVPIVSSVFYANPDFMHSLIVKLKFVEYPRSEYLKPTKEEFEKVQKAIRENQGKN